MGQGLRLALRYFLGHLRDGLVLLHARLLPKRLLPPVRRERRASGQNSFADLLHDPLQLVVPKELRAPLLQNHLESQVLGVAPPSADRARKPPPLAAKPGL